MTETELIDLLRQKDDQGMQSFLQTYGALMRYIIRPIVPDEREQEECVSDVALRIWEKIGQYEPEKGSFTTWITVITRNAALNRAKKQRPDTQELPQDLEDPQADPEKQLLQRERMLLLRRGLKALRQEEQMLLYRKYFYRQSIRQIAAELGTTERVVEGKLYRLKKKLRKQLGGDFFD